MVLRPGNGLSLCAGAGGLDMGLMLAETGFHTRCFVEWDEYPRTSIIAAQRAGYFAPAPIWDDVTSFDGRPFRGAIDTILAGYPCQPFSSAGQRKGENDERHLWPDIARIIEEVRPIWVILENVGGHVTLGAETVLRDLRGMGFTPAAGLFTAAETGAPHERKRWFCLAYSHGNAQHFADSRESDAGADGRHHVGGGSGKAMGNTNRSVNELQRMPEKIFCPSRKTSARRQGVIRNESWAAGTAVAQPASKGFSVGGCAQQPSPDQERGTGLVEKPERCGRDMAKSRAEGLQGAKGRVDAGAALQVNKSTSRHSGVGIHPPGPSDADAWASIIHHAPNFAPGVSFGDCKRSADHLAQMVAAGELAQEEAEPDLLRMVDGLAQRSRALKLLGNGVHPLAAANAIRSLGIAHGLRPLDLGASG